VKVRKSSVPQRLITVAFRAGLGCLGELGNIGSDPLFGTGYHLKSQAGRWDGIHWVLDAVTSPCIDAGDPSDVNWKNELWPHGSRVNMGAYGELPKRACLLLVMVFWRI